MEDAVMSNRVPATATQVDYEPWRPEAPVPREVVENDALMLRLDGGNAKDVLLYQVLNDLGTRPSSANVDVKEGELDVPASVWAALPQWLGDQEVETGAPPSLWCKDGH